MLARPQKPFSRMHSLQKCSLHIGRPHMKIARKSASPDAFNTSTAKYSRTEWAVFSLSLIVVVSYSAMLNLNNADLRYYVLPWLEGIREVGISKFLAGTTYNYTPLTFIFCTSSPSSPAQKIRLYM